MSFEFHQLLPVTRCQPVETPTARSSSARAVHLHGVHTEMFPTPSAPAPRRSSHSPGRDRSRVTFDVDAGRACRDQDTTVDDAGCTGRAGDFRVGADGAVPGGV